MNVFSPGDLLFSGRAASILHNGRRRRRRNQSKREEADADGYRTAMAQRRPIDSLGSGDRCWR